MHELKDIAHLYKTKPFIKYYSSFLKFQIHCAYFRSIYFILYICIVFASIFVSKCVYITFRIFIVFLIFIILTALFLLYISIS